MYFSVFRYYLSHGFPSLLGKYYVTLFLRKQKHLLLCVRLCTGFWDIKVSVVRQGPCLQELIFNT